MRRTTKRQPTRGEEIARHARRAQESGTLRLPVDFWKRRDVAWIDQMIVELLATRAALTKDPSHPAVRARRMHRAWTDSEPGDAVAQDVLLYVLHVAEAQDVHVNQDGAPIVLRSIDGGRPQWPPYTIHAPPERVRLMIAMGAIRAFLGKNLRKDLVRSAMWPERGKTKRSRGALARALGWDVTDDSLDAELPGLRTGKRGAGRRRAGRSS